MAHNNPYAVPFQPSRAPGTLFTVSGRNRTNQDQLFNSIQEHVARVEALTKNTKDQMASTNPQSSARTHPTQNQGTLQRVQAQLIQEQERRHLGEQNLQQCLAELEQARKEINDLQHQL